MNNDIMSHFSFSSCGFSVESENTRMILRFVWTEVNICAGNPSQLLQFDIIHMVEACDSGVKPVYRCWIRHIFNLWKSSLRFGLKVFLLRQCETNGPEQWTGASSIFKPRTSCSARILLLSVQIKVEDNWDNVIQIQRHLLSLRSISFLLIAPMFPTSSLRLSSERLHREGRFITELKQ